MIDLRKLELVVFDFDDTLCVEYDHAFLNQDDYTCSCMRRDAFEGCDASPMMQVFVSWCNLEKIPVGMCSATGFSVRAAAKLEWVIENYGVQMNNWSVGAREEKVHMLRSLARFYGIQTLNALIVDDDWQVLHDANVVGFQALNPIALFSAMLSPVNIDLFPELSISTLWDIQRQRRNDR